LNPRKFGDVEIFKSFKIFLKCYAKTFRFDPQILEILEILEIPEIPEIVEIPKTN
jgi:hypothetical protein